MVVIPVIITNKHGDIFMTKKVVKVTRNYPDGSKEELEIEVTPKKKTTPRKKRTTNANKDNEK